MGDDRKDIYKYLKPGVYNQVRNSRDQVAIDIFDKILNFDKSTDFLLKNGEEIFYWCVENYKISENYISQLREDLDKKYYYAILYFLYHFASTSKVIELSSTNKNKKGGRSEISHSAKIEKIESIINHLKKANQGVEKNIMVLRDIHDFFNQINEIQEHIIKAENILEIFCSVLKSNKGIKVNHRKGRLRKKFIKSIYDVYCHSQPNFKDQFKTDVDWLVQYCDEDAVTIGSGGACFQKVRQACMQCGVHLDRDNVSVRDANFPIEGLKKDILNWHKQ